MSLYRHVFGLASKLLPKVVNCNHFALLKILETSWEQLSCIGTLSMCGVIFKMETPCVPHNSFESLYSKRGQT